MVYKIIFIAVVVILLLLIETAVYILLRKLSKDEFFSKRHLDDAYIAGIGIIVLIAIMLWQNIEV